MLRKIDNHLWCAEDDLWMPGGMHFPLRMTIIRLSCGGLALHSPIKIPDALASEINELGPVRCLIAPNLFHHLFIAEAAARYPEAKLIGAPGFDTKRPDLTFEAPLDDSKPDPILQDTLGQIMIQGVPAFNETVFFHHKSKTLIVTDLMFNINQPKGWLAPLMFRMMGVYKRPAQSRLWRFITKNRPQAASSVEHMLAWPIQRLIMAHGDILEAPTPQQLQHIFSRMLSGQKTRKIA